MRTNVALTSNIKLVVDSKYNLYLESYDSNDILSDNRYKKFQINPDSFLSERIAKFYKDTPINEAFEVKEELEKDRVQLGYENQYDDIYFSGAREVEYSKHLEEFQYNTTLKISPNNLPKYFFIFRLEGTGLGDNLEDIYESLDDLKLIHTTDMRPNTDLGKFFVKNYIEDDEIPVAPFELNLNMFEFSKWHGYNYYTGGTVEKSRYMDEYFKIQQTDFDLEKFIIDGFEKNEVVCSNYLNLSHLFDDANAKIFVPRDKNNHNIWYKLKDYTFVFDMFNKKELSDINFKFELNNNELIFNVTEPISYRNRWSINRYVGLYADDLHYINKISPYYNDRIISDNDEIFIVNNIFLDINNNNISPLNVDYVDNEPVYLKINNSFYLIEQTKDENDNYTGEYHIVSDELINGRLIDFIQNAEPVIKIDYSVHVGETEYRNYLYNSKTNEYYQNPILDQFFFHSDSYNKTILLIKMFDKFYKLNRMEAIINGETTFRYYINTDEILRCDNIRFKSLLLNKESVKPTNVVNKENDMIFFEIYQVRLTDIEDFDFTHLYTDHANFEYETTLLMDNELDPAFNTSMDLIPSEHVLMRPIFFGYDLETAINNTIKVSTNLKYVLYDSLNDFKWNLFTNKYILPYSSEYSANGDLYRLDNLEISDIWNQNQYVNKFSFSGSNDINSLPYKLNNSLEIWNRNNKGFDIEEKDISLFGHNLDWFYTFGTPIRDNIETPLVIDDIIDYSNRQRYTYEYYRTLNIDYHDFKKPGEDTSRELFLEFNYDNYLKEHKFNYLEYYLNEPAHINTGTNDGHGNFELVYKNVNRFAILNETDDSNGSLFMYKGLTGFVEYVELEDYDDITSDQKVYLANDLSNYKMTAIIISRETEDDTLWGKSGIDFIINKYHGHILICIYIYVGIGQIINLEYTKRDHFYNPERNNIKYTVNDNEYVDSELTIHDIILHEIYNIMSNDLTSHPNFSMGINYKIIEPLNEYIIKYLTSTDIEFETEHEFLNNETVEINGINYKIERVLDKYSIRVDSTVTGINGDIVKYAKSVKPFKFRLLGYNVTPCNTLVNESYVEEDNITGFNNDDRLLDENKEIEVEPKEGIIYPSKNKEKMVYHKKQNLELTDSKTSDFIHRYSGYYEPMQRSLNLLEKNTLNDYVFFNNANTQQENVFDGTTITINVLNGEASFQLDKTHINFNYISKYLISNLVIILKKKNSLDMYPTNIISSFKDITFDGVNYTFYMSIDDYFVDGTYTFEEAYFKFVFNNNTYLNFDSCNSGIIKELVISKVDPDMSYTKDILLIYPYMDEHGMTTIDKNIFIPNWNKEFFKRKKRNKYNII